MIRRILPAVLGGGLLLAGSLRAQENPVNPPSLPPPTPAVVGEACGESCHTRSVPHIKGTIVERNRAVAKPEVRIREVTKKVPVETIEVEWKEHKQTVDDVEVKPRVVEQQIVCHSMKPFEEVDPCTGKCCTVYKSVPEVKTVKVTLYDTVPVQRTVIVKVPCLKCVTKEVNVTTLCLEDVTVPAIETRLEVIFKENCLPVPPCPKVVEHPAPCVKEHCIKE